MNAPLPITERILKRVQITPDGCWEWQGFRTKHGYGRMGITVGRKKQRPMYVHRASYQAFRGPLTAGLVIDHLCRNRACVNPAHLEEVTDFENRSRGLKSPAKTHCINGHEYDEENTYWLGNSRKCRACNRAAVARLKARRIGVSA